MNGNLNKKIYYLFNILNKNIIKKQKIEERITKSIERNN